VLGEQPGVTLTSEPPVDRPRSALLARRSTWCLDVLDVRRAGVGPEDVSGAGVDNVQLEVLLAPDVIRRADRVEAIRVLGVAARSRCRRDPPARIRSRLAGRDRRSGVNPILGHL